MSCEVKDRLCDFIADCIYDGLIVKGENDTLISPLGNVYKSDSSDWNSVSGLHNDCIKYLRVQKFIEEVTKGM